MNHVQQQEWREHFKAGGDVLVSKIMQDSGLDKYTLAQQMGQYTPAQREVDDTLRLAAANYVQLVERGACDGVLSQARDTLEEAVLLSCVRYGKEGERNPMYRTEDGRFQYYELPGQDGAVAKPILVTTVAAAVDVFAETAYEVATLKRHSVAGQGRGGVGG
jgi:hypothetical protein